jgi:plastocyanin domain-containing protein
LDKVGIAFLARRLHMMRLLRTGLLVVSLALLGMAAQEMKENKTVATLGPDGIQRVDVIGGSYYFDPDVIVLKVNVPVELKVKKAGGATPHSIACRAAEAGIDFSVSLKAEPKIIKFTPTKVGTYAFWCTKKFLFLKSHKAHGMTGTFEVVE